MVLKSFCSMTTTTNMETHKRKNKKPHTLVISKNIFIILKARDCLLKIPNVWIVN